MKRRILALLALAAFALAAEARPRQSRAWLSFGGETAAQAANRTGSNSSNGANNYGAGNWSE